ncbi:hypothetical protein ASE61_15005 [Bosea sp. Root670]|uniref:transcription termination/antitermination protein NusG n=1 Tax=Bosea sp. Root670 TaxID=1736583 RepID=UPI000713D778|nr:transcription termination/antitermination NusG family protein [Bosea sp. Root670]KRE02586.1 hypothetical protein ASE61_15005 [Bosea sp. Root670]
MGRRHEKKPFVHFRDVQETKVPAPEDLDLGRDWYLVHCAPRMEAKAAKGLADAGCSVFLPAIRRVIRFQRRETDHQIATFTGYLFASGVPTLGRDRYLVADDGVTVITINGRPLTDIREIEGVMYIVRSQEGWARVPGDAIAKVAAYQNDAVEPRRDILRPDPKLSPGQRVKVISGPFMGFLAEVTEQLGLAEAEVLIELLGKPVPMTVRVEHLDAA